ncbi:MAG: BACON domain-containing protein [Bacteroidales bacterium]|nr:BACON domain-containing protein [Bacteroidales bacterium]
MADAKSNTIMAWSECSVDIANTASNDAMAADSDLWNIGTIKYQSSTLEPSDGDTLEMKKTGGGTYAKETGEGGYTLTTRVIEPGDDLYVKLGLGEISGTDLNVTTHVVDGNWSVKVTPKNAGAIGIKAPKCSITFKPGWSEEDGNYVDITFEILMGEAGYWYSRFKKLANGLELSKSAVYFDGAGDTSTGQSVTVSASGTVTAASSDTSWCTVSVTNSTTVVVKAAANNTGAIRNATVTVKADGKTSTIAVTQIPSAS